MCSVDATLTQPSLVLVLVTLRPLPPSAAEHLKDDVDVWEDDEGGRQDGAVVESHDQLVTLELPHLVRDGLHLKEGVTEQRKRKRLASCCGPRPPAWTFAHISWYSLLNQDINTNLKTAISRLTSRMFATSR